MKMANASERTLCVKCEGSHANIEGSGNGKHCVFATKKNKTVGVCQTQDTQLDSLFKEKPLSLPLPFGRNSKLII